MICVCPGRIGAMSRSGQCQERRRRAQSQGRCERVFASRQSGKTGSEWLCVSWPGHMAEPLIEKPDMSLTDKPRPHSRSAEAEVYRKLYRDKRWCGPHGIRQQALLRDLYTCQRCTCLLVTGNRHQPALPSLTTRQRIRATRLGSSTWRTRKPSANPATTR
jgi:hypothetical protein